MIFKNPRRTAQKKIIFNTIKDRLSRILREMSSGQISDSKPRKNEIRNTLSTLPSLIVKILSLVMSHNGKWIYTAIIECTNLSEIDYWIRWFVENTSGVACIQIDIPNSSVISIIQCSKVDAKDITEYVDGRKRRIFTCPPSSPIWCNNKPSLNPAHILLISG